MKNMLLLGMLMFPALVMVAPMAAAQDCSNIGNVIAVATPAGTIYLDDRRAPGSSTPGLVGGSGTWIYLESNGQAGLQRGGVAVWDVTGGSLDAEICTESATPDTLLE